MSGLELSARERAAFEVRDRIRRVAVTVFGAGEVQEPIDGFSTTRSVLDEPLAGVSAARLVLDVAEGQLREWALRARGAGAGWDDVADALGLAGCENPDWRAPGEVAWEWLVEHRPPAPTRSLIDRPTSAVWTCTTCRARVRDTGPYASHPDDREHGHTTGCARHDAARAAWRQDNDWED